MSAVTKSVRQTVLERDLYSCVRCGRYIGPFGSYSLQHRRARGMGGSRAADTNTPANLVTVCGHATEPDRCHQWIESHPVEAERLGYRVRQGANPAGVPVLTATHGWVLLDNEGTYEEVSA